MPATPGIRLETWNEPPFIALGSIEAPDCDSRVFDIYSETDVTTCLIEDDPGIDALRWTLSDDEINQLALESAKAIIAERRALKEKREAELEKMAHEKESASTHMATVVVLRQNPETGSTTAHTIPRPSGRSLG